MLGGLCPVALVKELAETFFASIAASGVRIGVNNLALTDCELFAIDSIVAECNFDQERTRLIRVPILKLDPAAIIPSQANPDDAGVDLYSIEEVTLTPFARVAVRTGIAIALPEGTVGLVHPRSGLALKQGLAVLNSPGTIDAGYRGEIKIILINLDPKNDILISPGDRIAQLVIQEFKAVEFELVSELTESDRGSGGFGSTGQ